MIRRTHASKEWDEYDTALKQLYGITEDADEHPLFGCSILLPLTLGDAENRVQMTRNERKQSRFEMAGDKELVKPTLPNLALHFRYFDWVNANVNTLMRAGKFAFSYADFDKRFFDFARDGSIQQFEDQMIKPLRKHLINREYRPLYFYCLPSVSLESNPETGTPIMGSGENVLCLLPTTVDVAKQYGLTEPEIALLAPQVLWLIKNNCGRSIIKTRVELELALDRWHEYVNMDVNQHITKLIETTSPHLLIEMKKKIYK